MQTALNDQAILIPSEGIAPCTAFFKRAIAGLKPVGSLEEQAAQNIANEQRLTQSAINLQDYHHSIETQWQPADFGFVFTSAELDTDIRRNTSREKAAHYYTWHDLNAT